MSLFDRKQRRTKNLRKRDPSLGEGFKAEGQLVPPLASRSARPADASRFSAGTPKASFVSSHAEYAGMLGLLCGGSLRLRLGVFVCAQLLGTALLNAECGMQKSKMGLHDRCFVLCCAVRSLTLHPC